MLGNRATALRNWRIENIWLTQKMMASLYDVDVRTINEHIKKIYSDSELEEDATIRNFRIVQKDYTIKGWVMDDERLKNIVPFRINYICLFDYLFISS